MCEQHDSPAPEHVSYSSQQAQDPQGIWAAPHKWDFTLSQLNPHTVAITGTTVSVTASTSEMLMGIFWPLGTSAPHTERTHQVLPVSLRSTHTFLGAVFVQLMLNTAGHELSKTVKKFLSCEDFSFQTVTPVCLLYKQTSHLSLSSSPAHPSQSLTQVNLQPFRDNIPWSKNSGNLQRCLLQTCLIDHHFNSKQKKFFLVMGH